MIFLRYNHLMAMMLRNFLAGIAAIFLLYPVSTTGTEEDREKEYQARLDDVADHLVNLKIFARELFTLTLHTSEHYREYTDAFRA